MDHAFLAVKTGTISAWAGTNPKTKPFTQFQTSAGEVLGGFSVSVTDPSGSNPLITSTGYVPSQAAGATQRTVQAKLSPRSFFPFSNGVFFGRDKVNITGSCETDSYDSGVGVYGGSNIHRGLPGTPDEGKGNIVTYGTISGAVNLTGTTKIYGDAATGPGGSKTGAGVIYGEILTNQVPDDPANPLPRVTVPTELSSLPFGVNGQWSDEGLLTKTGSNTASIPAGDWKLARIKLTASAKVYITGPARIYLTGYINNSIDQSGSGSQIVCNGPVEFYADQKLSISGSGIVNSGGIPSDLKIWGTPSCTDVNITGSADFYGVVYAPNSKIDPAGSGQRYGAFVGKTVESTWSGIYHYDEALHDLGIPGSGYEIAYWQEKE